MSKATDFISLFKMHRDVTVGVVKTLEDADINFRPWDGALSLGDLAWHTVSSAYFFSTAALALDVRESKRPEQPEFHTMSEVIQAVEEWTAKTEEVLAQISDEQFDAMVDMTPVFGREVKCSSLLHLMRDHEIHHKGQLYVYARMVGADKLPMFVKAN